VVTTNEAGFIVKLIAGVIWLAAGAVSLFSRRLLDTRRTA
jgi:hypothetical protein